MFRTPTHVISLILFFFSSIGLAKTVCSITLNSPDEIEAFKKKLAPQGFRFVELVTANKSNTWFSEACQSGLQCDVLVVSGHFGGLFFGEQSSNTITLGELEKTSCQNTCPGILKKPKEVFLMGCNTLATQKPDHRTMDQYLDVLVNDGIPLSFAEEVAASRYSQLGFSLERRFAAVFDQSTKLYGFSSTAPIGSQAAGPLNAYLARVGNYQNHLEQLSSLPNRVLQQSFAGTSFQETAPILALENSSRALFCALQSEDAVSQTQALENIVRADLVTEYFDSLATLFKHTRSEMQINWSAAVKNDLVTKLESIAQNQFGRIAVRNQVLNIEEGLGLISPEQKIENIDQLLREAYSRDLGYQRITQINAIIASESRLVNPSYILLNALAEKSTYTISSLANYSSINTDGRQFLLDKIAQPKNEYERTLAVESMRKFWNASDLPKVQSMWSTLSVPAKRQVYLSGHDILKSAGYTLSSGSSLDQCIQRSDAAGGKDDGINWSCLTKNPTALTPDVCNYFALQNSSDEKADDMRWFCWDHIRALHEKNNPECYILANSMRILGNQMKQVWNCGHR